MSQHDEQLVRQIVEQVLANLHQQGGQAASTAPATHAQVRPPIGICTGDYSQFTELQGKPVGAAGPKPSSPPPPAPEPAGLSGIITAQQLQDAMKTAADGVAVLAADARLTPLANDLARQHPEKIRRVGHASSNSGGGAGATNGTLPWLWWADGFCPAVQALTHRLGARLRPSAAPRSDTGLVQVVRDLAAAVDSRTVQGGLLFVQQGALPLCYANRVAALRAVLGNCEEAVEQGVAHLGTNVLIIEYPHTKPEAMNRMVERMLRQPPRPPIMVERHLAELRGRG